MKNKILVAAAISGWALSGALYYKLFRLDDDFKKAQDLINKHAGVVRMARDIVVTEEFKDIIDFNDM